MSPDEKIGEKFNIGDSSVQRDIFRRHLVRRISKSQSRKIVEYIDRRREDANTTLRTQASRSKEMSSDEKIGEKFNISDSSIQRDVFRRHLVRRTRKSQSRKIVEYIDRRLTDANTTPHTLASRYKEMSSDEKIDEKFNIGDSSVQHDIFRRHLVRRISKFQSQKNVGYIDRRRADSITTPRTLASRSKGMSSDEKIGEKFNIGDSSIQRDIFRRHLVRRTRKSQSRKIVEYIDRRRADSITTPRTLASRSKGMSSNGKIGEKFNIGDSSVQRDVFRQHLIRRLRKSQSRKNVGYIDRRLADANTTPRT